MRRDLIFKFFIALYRIHNLYNSSHIYPETYRFEPTIAQSYQLYCYFLYIFIILDRMMALYGLTPLLCFRLDYKWIMNCLDLLKTQVSYILPSGLILILEEVLSNFLSRYKSPNKINHASFISDFLNPTSCHASNMPFWRQF